MGDFRMRELDSILSESPLYKTLSDDERRSVIRVLVDNYSFLRMKTPDQRTVAGKAGDTFHAHPQTSFDNIVPEDIKALRVS